MVKIIRNPKKIEIKVKKSEIWQQVIMSVIFLAVSIFFIVICRDIEAFNWKLVVMLGFIVFFGVFFAVKDLFPLFRIIVMDAEGCTVSWLIFKKKHKWDEFCIVEECSWKKIIGYRGTINYHGMIFSTKPVKRNSPKKIVRSFDFLNCFYVLFDTSGVYSVNREKFIMQLKSWGVVLKTKSR